jgi:hypothetical protein
MLTRVAVLLCFLCISCGYQAVGAVGGGNLAMHKSYTILPKPNYPLCTDEQDTTQLTDGRALGSDWVNKSTVGWVAGSTAPEIIIDLENIEYIDEVRVYSIGGGVAGVEFPRYITVFVSNDGKDFKFVGALSSNDAIRTDKHKIARSFAIKNLGVKSRFVKVQLHPDGMFTFLDEIEIIGDSAQAQIRHKYAKKTANIEAVRKRVELIDKISATFDAVEKNQITLGKDFSDKTISAIDMIVKSPAITSDANVCLLQSIGREVDIIRASIYKKVYGRAYVCMVAEPMEILQEKQMLILKDEAENQIDIELWRGEYESAAVNIVNCSDKSINLITSISPLTSPDDKVINSHEVFTIRRALFVNSRRIGSVGDALVLQGEEPFNLEPGQVSQIWLTVHCPTLNAGEYKASFAVVPTGKDSIRLPVEQLGIRVKVEPIEFPREIGSKVMMYTYLGLSSITKVSIPKSILDLEKHYTNVFTIHPVDIPFPSKTSSLSTITDYTKLDNILRLSNYNKTYIFYLSFSNEWTQRCFGKWASNSWNHSFSLWLKDLTKHLNSKNIGYNQFAIFPFDEILGDEFYKLTTFIKEVDPNIRIFANSFGKNDSDYERFKGLIDIWCLSQSDSLKYPERIEFLKNSGRSVWTYATAGPGKANHPYSYYRLLAWHAFKREQTGIGFWIYSDEGDHNNQWDDDMLAVAGPWGVIYGSADSSVDTSDENIIPSRRWEAWREGIEDYEYLFQLQEEINKKRTVSRKDAEQLQQFLNKQIEYVLQDADDCSRVYKARQLITKMLESTKISETKRQNTALAF